MKTAKMNTSIIDGYIELLSNLSPDNKLDLISKLTLSVKTDLADKNSSFKKAFGALKTKKNADQLIDEIRSSRNFKRIIEKS